MIRRTTTAFPPRLGRRLSALALGVVAVVLLASTPAPAIPGVGGFRVLFEADSVYHHIVVVEDAEARYLRFDRSFQSGMYLHDTFESPFRYPAYAHLGLIFSPPARRVLFVGLGGGSIPKRFWRDYPDVVVDVAELDPMVVDVAKRFFALPDDRRLQVTVADGRLFLRNTRERYDLIVLDAYYAEAIPFHLTTREFMQLTRFRLTPGGVVVSNIIGALQGPQSRLFRAMYRTTAEIFPSLYLFPVAYRPYNDPETLRNIILMAQAEQKIAREEILRRAGRLRGRVTYRDFLRYAGDYYDRPIAVADVPVLTDDYAPVDTLLPVYHWAPRP